MHFHTRLGGKPQSEDAPQKLATLLDRTGWVGDPANGQYRISIVSEREETLEEARECLAAIGISAKIARRGNGPSIVTFTGRDNFQRLHAALSDKLADASKRERLEALANVGPQGGTRVSAEIRQRIVSLRERGLSVGQIVEALVADGLPTVRGGRWSKSTVHRVLTAASREIAKDLR